MLIYFSVLLLYFPQTYCEDEFSPSQEQPLGDNSERMPSYTELAAEFQKAQSRLLEILKEPRFSWIFDKLSERTAKNSVPSRHSNELEESVKQVEQDDFSPHRRRSLLQANLPIAHLMYQGDMLLTNEQANHIYHPNSNDGNNKEDPNTPETRSKRQAAFTGATFPMNRWNPTVPISYYFDVSIPPKTRDIIRAAIKFWQDHTCITFKEDGKVTPKVRFFQGPGCLSEVGKDVSGKESQHVSIGSTCSFFAPIAHEIGHVLGMIHTHARYDRDKNIDILYKNVPKSMDDQFEKETRKTSSNHDVPYDYGSIMHYTGYNQQTGKVIMAAKQGKYQHSMGNTYGPIFADLLVINRHYNCEDFCLDQVRITCHNSGIVNPKKCSECICPNGFGGDDCSQRAEGEGGAPKECGQTVRATRNYQTLKGDVEANPNGQLRQAGCHWHIQAPPGMRVEIIMNSTTGKCSNECLYGAVEIKFENLARGGARLCCQEHVSDIGPVVSTGEMAVVSDYSQQGTRTFTLKYRAVHADPTKVTPPDEDDSDFDNGDIPDMSDEEVTPPPAEDETTIESNVDATMEQSPPGIGGNGWNPCLDYSDQCQLLSGPLNYYCTDQQYSQYFMMFCPFTCGLCPATQFPPPDRNYYNCINYAPACHRFRSYCQNGAVAQICPKTCRVCGADGDNGGRGPVDPPITDCVDAIDGCAENWDLCSDRGLQSSMSVLCARTCGQCSRSNSQGLRPGQTGGRGGQVGTGRDPTRGGIEIPGVGMGGGGNAQNPFDPNDPYRPDVGDGEDEITTVAPEVCEDRREE
ncbi:astacin (Peptidase family m12A) domain-containing protein [Ditylenchus destructor]|uniref:Metalloendopeptidase n=1 Tax=Ditylenchus destructor TaxID=166010 RepID=A0AAD4N580_9BILA|nr:astacin (Peptidase family m12A) domain-containing protein [Ditylenchus destructor]